MRLKRVQLPTRNTPGRHFGARGRRRRLIPVSTGVAAVFALGCAGALAVHAPTGNRAGAQLTSSGRQPAQTAPLASSPSPATAALSTTSASEPLAPLGTGVVSPAVKPFLTRKLLKAVPVGPQPVSQPVKAVLTSLRVTTALDADGIPAVALEAYQHAATVLATNDPSCHLPWELLAAIGRVESDDGRFGGSSLLPNGDTTIPIYGIPLDGRNGVALVRDTDHGRLDGDPNFDRAVGPMQFLPSTWEEYGVDGNGDGKVDINNIFDASLAAAGYLCAGGGNMDNPAQEAAAVLRYNDADEYVHVVLSLAASYEHGHAATVPPAAGSGGPPPSAPAGPTTTTPAVATAPPTTTTPAPATPGTTTPPAPSTTTTTVPTPGQPNKALAPKTTQKLHPGQHVDIGWAPAMRQVVLKLLSTPKKTSPPSSSS